MYSTSGNTNVTSSWQWYPLNKSDLEKIVTGATGLTGGKLQDRAGVVFENTFHDWMQSRSDVGYRPNKEMFNANVKGRVGVIPDTISTLKILSSDGEIMLYPDASWYEVKAGRGTISGSSYDWQAGGLVAALFASNPVLARSGHANLTFATTWNMNISAGFVYGVKANYGVNIDQLKAIYRYNPNIGDYQVSFYDPKHVSETQMRYLIGARPSVRFNYK